MASISTDAGGNVPILFMAPGGGRKAVRLGKVTQKLAAAVKLRVEALSSAAAAGVPADPQTAAWVAGVGDDLAAKLAAVGLIPRGSRSGSAPSSTSTSAGGPPTATPSRPHW